MGSPEAGVATPRVAAGALFVDDRGRVLLVHPTYKDTWEVPGGCVEPGESPAAACRRELREELALDRVPQRLIAVDWAPNDRDGDKLLFLFDCGPLGADEGRIAVDGEEIDRWQWVDPDDFDDHLIPRLSRRLRSALRSIADDTVYLEHGDPP
ncbi:NUDIX domain-containing protein [Pseudonocardia sichuanensis]